VEDREHGGGFIDGGSDEVPQADPVADELDLIGGFDFEQGAGVAVRQIDGAELAGRFDIVLGSGQRLRAGEEARGSVRKDPVENGLPVIPVVGAMEALLEVGAARPRMKSASER